MPGVRPDSIGPVWGVTAWRTSTSVVGFGGAGGVGSARSSSASHGRRRRRGWSRAARWSRTGWYRARPAPASGACRAPDGTGTVRAMTDQPIGLHRGGPPETVLPADPADVLAALDAARARRRRRRAARAAARDRPRAPALRHRVGARSATSRATTSRRTRTSASATTAGSTSCASRAGAARATCGRSHPENRGFLAALDGLRRTADAIGETDEADRCAEFLFQLDPNPEGSGESRLPG